MGCRSGKKPRIPAGLRIFTIRAKFAAYGLSSWDCISPFLETRFGNDLMASEADLVEMCMEQISTNMEELTFLRQLAGHLKLQSASRGVESSLVTLLLPTLQEAASAEYVAFLVTQETEDQRDWLVRSESPETRETRNVARIMGNLAGPLPHPELSKGVRVQPQRAESAAGKAFGSGDSLLHRGGGPKRGFAAWLAARHQQKKQRVPQPGRWDRGGRAGIRNARSLPAQLGRVPVGDSRPKRGIVRAERIPVSGRH